MKRNSLSAKLLALLLSVMMVIGCLPFSAFAEEDWESELDAADPIPGSSAETPWEVSFEMDMETMVGTATVVVPASTTYYFVTNDPINDMVMTANGEAVDVVYGSMRNPSTWTIVNSEEVDVEYLLMITYPEGTTMNPQDLSDGETTVSLEADSQGWFFDFVAYSDGYVTFTIYGENGWQWAIDNTTAGTYGDRHTSNDDDYVSSQTFKYTDGDVYQIMANTFDAENPYNAPAGDITITVDFLSGWGTEESPYLLTDASSYVNIAAGETAYFECYFSGTNMSVYGPDNFVVNYGGEEYATSWGSVESLFVESAGFRMPVTFSITNNAEESGEFYINFAYPEGTINNPQDLWENEVSSHTFEAGAGAYYYDYIGYYDGTLTFKITADCGWQYVINNITAGTYGDIQWSDSDPVVTEQTFAYTAGEEYVIEIATYDPADMSNSPAGTINVEVIFQAGFGTEEAPFILNDMESVVNVSGNEPVFYQGNFAGMDLTISGEGEFSAIIEGETIAAVDGKVTYTYPAAMGRPMPNLIGIIGEGEYSIIASYPSGTQMNPATAILGDNATSIAAGNQQGYFYTFIATEDGDLTFKVPSATEGVAYDISVMNNSTWAMLTLAEDGVDGVLTVPVTAGDELNIVVSTVPDASWNYPAADLTVNLSYKEIEVSTGTILDTGRSLTFNSVVFINQYFKIDGFENLTSEYILEKGGVLVWTTPVTEEEAVFGFGTPDVLSLTYTGSEYRAQSNGIPAAEFSIERYLRAYIQVEDGSYVYGPLKTYSVQQYCENQINKATAKQTLKNACIAMLHYGAAAQIRFNTNVEDLANATIAATHPNFAYDSSWIDIPADPEIGITANNSAVWSTGKSLLFDGAILVKYYFKTNLNVASAELLVWNNVNGVLTEENVSYTAELTLSGSEYAGYSNQIPPAEYGWAITTCAKITDTDGNVYYGGFVTYNPEVYVNNQVNKPGVAEAQLNLCKAMLIYGEYVKQNFA